MFAEKAQSLHLLVTKVVVTLRSVNKLGANIRGVEQKSTLSHQGGGLKSPKKQVWSAFLEGGGV